MAKHLHPDDLRALAERLLRATSEPSVRIRILRDVIGVSSTDVRYRAVHDELIASPQVLALAAEQREDGGWGRLHSRDSSGAWLVPTTEWAVERAIALGFDGKSAVLCRAADYLAGILTGDVVPTDRPERNDRWPTGVRLFAAATLSWIDPRDTSLDDAWGLWHEIVKRAFADGSYDSQREAEAHRELTGASVRASYLVLSNRYALTLLGARAERIDRALQHRVFDWLDTRLSGIGYLDAPLVPPGEATSSGLSDRWLRSHEILSRFSVWPERTAGAAEWLMAHRRDDGLWDLGARTSSSPCLPLSATWRKKDARAVDWTTRVLCLLAARIRRSSQNAGG